MSSYKDNIDRIQVIAAGLKELARESIFIGGACVQFYVLNPKLRDFRPTRDIDCIVKIGSYSEFNRFSGRLRELGFTHDTSENAPIVRWIFKDILVDTIPDESTIAGFRKIPWFKEGRTHAILKELPSGIKIHILPLSYFLATKLDASKDRGSGDYLVNHDLEDIINIIDGNDSLTEILSAPLNVKNYIIRSFSELLKDPDFKRSISGHIGFESSAAERAKDVADKMTEIIHLNK